MAKHNVISDLLLVLGLNDETRDIQGEQKNGEKRIDTSWTNERKNFIYFSVDSLKFLEEQSRIKLSETLKNFDLISSRAIGLIKLLIPATIGLTIYSLGFSGYEGDVSLSWSINIGSCLLLIAVILLFIQVFATWAYSPGIKPENYLNDFYFDKEDLGSEELFKNLLLARVIDYQKEIKHNLIANEKKLAFLNISVALVLITLAIILTELFLISISS